MQQTEVDKLTSITFFKLFLITDSDHAVEINGTWEKL